MMRLLSLLSVASLLLAGPLPLRAQEVDYTDHFRVFTGDGQPASLEDVVEAMEGAEAVLVGETHTDPVGHWLEAELFRRALDRFHVGEDSGALRPVALSLEFFERDVQDVLNEYLAGLISEEQFLDAARPATYYASDHRPMVEEAKERGLPVIASNAPRRYVNRVSRGGREALNDLPPSARRFLPPLPYPQSTEAYRAEWTELMSNMTMEDQCPAPEEVAGEEEEESAAEMPPPHGVAARPDSAPSTPHGMPPSPHGPPGGMPASFIENGLHAQTLWDASMAYAITTYLRLNPGAMVFHVVGGFHVENFTGTPEKVQYYRPGTRTLVVSMELAEDVESFDPEEHGGLGDFVILTDEALDENIARNCAPEGEGG